MVVSSSDGKAGRKLAAAQTADGILENEEKGNLRR